MQVFPGDGVVVMLRGLCLFFKWERSRSQPYGWEVSRGKFRPGDEADKEASGHVDSCG